MMKNSILILASLVLLFTVSCKDEPSNTDPATDAHFPPTPLEISRVDTLEELETVRENSPAQGPAAAATSNLQGKYVKEGKVDAQACNCYCLDLSAGGTSELCLEEDKLYINVRLEKRDNNVGVYFAGPSSKTSTDIELPWEDFDRNVPIARIISINENKVEFNWLGFSINGDLAKDYAIYGKETLEGIYKKQ